MIIVTGEARSGTSLMMRIMKELGYDLGDTQKYIPGQREFMNPEGFWEIQWLVYQGIKAYMFDSELPAPDHVEPHQEIRWETPPEVVKLTTIGFHSTEFTSPIVQHHVTGMIYCIRNPREVIVSQRNQRKWESDKRSYKHYNLNCARTVSVLTEEAYKDFVCIMDYNELMKNPGEEIGWLCKFLGKLPTESAINCINPKLYRSKKKEAKKNREAELFYDWFKKSMKNQRTYWR